MTGQTAGSKEAPFRGSENRGVQLENIQSDSSVSPESSVPAQEGYKKQRRQLFIKKDFQLKIILIILLTVIIFANISGIIIYSFFTRSLGTQAILDYVGARDPSEIILQVILITEAIGIIVVFFITLFISHNLAGPIYKIEKTLSQVAEGDLSETINLRKGDEFQELAIELNSAIEGIREKVETMDSAVRELEKASTGLKDQQKDAVSGSLKEIRSALESFRLQKTP